MYPSQCTEWPHLLVGVEVSGVNMMQTLASKRLLALHVVTASVVNTCTQNHQDHCHHYHHYSVTTMVPTPPGNQTISEEEKNHLDYRCSLRQPLKDKSKVSGDF